MKIVFILKRTNEYKYFSGLVNYLYKKIPVEIWLYDLNTKKVNDLKSYLSVKNFLKKKFLKNKIKIVYFDKKKEITNFIISNSSQVDFFLSYDFIMERHFCISELFLQSIKFKWCVIMHGMDTFVNLKFLGAKELNFKEFYFFYISKYMFLHGIEWFKNFLPRKNLIILKEKKNIFNVGNCSLFLKPNNNLKKNVQQLIYLPFPYYKERYSEIRKDFCFQAAFSGQFITYKDNYLKNIKNKILNELEIFRNKKKVQDYHNYYNELNVVKSISFFCKRNNIKFVVKPRLKFPYINQLNSIADKIIYDDETNYSPTLLQKELSKTSLLVGSLTTSIFESVYFNVPFINIEIPKLAFIDKSDYYFYNYKLNSYYNYPGAVYNFSIKDFINSFSYKKLDDFKLIKNKRKAYLKKFCGIKTNYNSSKNFFNILKKIKKNKN
jgi:hypothetical protein